MQDLPQVILAIDEEVFRFIQEQALFGLGIGYTDAHLLVATRLSPNTQLWTRDRRLKNTSVHLKLACELSH